MHGHVVTVKLQTVNVMGIIKVTIEFDVLMRYQVPLILFGTG